MREHFCGSMILLNMILRSSSRGRHKEYFVIFAAFCGEDFPPLWPPCPELVEGLRPLRPLRSAIFTLPALGRTDIVLC